MPAVQVDVWSDIACPWCWVGKRRLEAAIALTDADVHVTFHAYQLNPAAPAAFEGDPDYVGRLANKYRRTRAEAQSMIDMMTRTGSEAGIEFAFDKVLPVNTFTANRVLAYAKAQGRGLATKEELLRSYFTHGDDVGKPEHLASAAERAGLSRDAVLTVARGDAHTEEVQTDLANARALQITGVPFFLIGGKYAVSGAQPADALASVLDQAAEATEGAPDMPLGEACGPDGCKIG